LGERCSTCGALALEFERSVRGVQVFRCRRCHAPEYRQPSD
jgi:hypothetical protein